MIMEAKSIIKFAKADAPRTDGIKRLSQSQVEKNTKSLLEDICNDFESIGVVKEEKSPGKAVPKRQYGRPRIPVRTSARIQNITPSTSTNITLLDNHSVSDVPVLDSASSMAQLADAEIVQTGDNSMSLVITNPRLIQVMTGDGVVTGDQLVTEEPPSVAAEVIYDLNEVGKKKPKKRFGLYTSTPKLPMLKGRSTSFFKSRPTVGKARRISSLMKARFSKQLQETGLLTCGCNKSFKNYANFVTHYRWCSGVEEGVKHCPYCSSVIFASSKAVLQHMTVEHPDKVAEYKANFPLPDDDYEGTETTRSSVTATKGFSNKENRLKLKNKGKTLHERMAENIREFSKSVRFDRIVSKNGSVQEMARTAEALHRVTELKIPRGKRFRLLPKNLIVEEGKYFQDPEDLNEAPGIDLEGVRIDTKSRLVLGLERYKRYNEYLKLTRDWSSHRKTYSKPKSEGADSSADLSMYSFEMQGSFSDSFQDFHQLTCDESELNTTEEFQEMVEDVELAALGPFSDLKVKALKQKGKGIKRMRTASVGEASTSMETATTSSQNTVALVKAESAVKKPNRRLPVITFGKLPGFKISKGDNNAPIDFDTFVEENRLIQKEGTQRRDGVASHPQKRKRGRPRLVKAQTPQSPTVQDHEGKADARKKNYIENILSGTGTFTHERLQSMMKQKKKGKRFKKKMNRYIRNLNVFGKRSGRRKISSLEIGTVEDDLKAIRRREDGVEYEICAEVHENATIRKQSNRELVDNSVSDETQAIGQISHKSAVKPPCISTQQNNIDIVEKELISDENEVPDENIEEIRKFLLSTQNVDENASISAKDTISVDSRAIVPANDNEVSSSAIEMNESLLVTGESILEEILVPESGSTDKNFVKSSQPIISEAIEKVNNPESESLSQFVESKTTAISEVCEMEINSGVIQSDAIVVAQNIQIATSEPFEIDSQSSTLRTIADEEENVISEAIGVKVKQPVTIAEIELEAASSDEAEPIKASEEKISVVHQTEIQNTNNEAEHQFEVIEPQTVQKEDKQQAGLQLEFSCTKSSDVAQKCSLETNLQEISQIEITQDVEMQVTSLIEHSEQLREESNEPEMHETSQLKTIQHPEPSETAIKQLEVAESSVLEYPEPQAPVIEVKRVEISGQMEEKVEAENKISEQVEVEAVNEISEQVQVEAENKISELVQAEIEAVNKIPDQLQVEVKDINEQMQVEVVNKIPEQLQVEEKNINEQVQLEIEGVCEIQEQVQVEAAQSEQNEHAVAGEVVTPQTLTAKRSRGRPRKKTVEKSPSSSQSNLTMPEVGQIHNPEILKRPRGRPKKVVPTPKNVVSPVVVFIAKEPTITLILPPKKRKQDYADQNMESPIPEPQRKKLKELPDVLSPVTAPDQQSSRPQRKSAFRARQYMVDLLRKKPKEEEDTSKEKSLEVEEKFKKSEENKVKENKQEPLNSEDVQAEYRKPLKVRGRKKKSIATLNESDGTQTEAKDSSKIQTNDSIEFPLEAKDSTEIQTEAEASLRPSKEAKDSSEVPAETKNSAEIQTEVKESVFDNDQNAQALQTKPPPKKRGRKKKKRRQKPVSKPIERPTFDDVKDGFATKKAIPSQDVAPSKTIQKIDRRKKVVEPKLGDGRLSSFHPQFRFSKVDDNFFPRYFPRKSMFKLLDQSECKDFLPKSIVTVKIENQISSTEWIQLKPFDALQAHGNSRATFYTGFPVTRCAFLPTPSVRDPQYLAVATSDVISHGKHCYDGKTDVTRGLIQIWSLGPLASNVLKCDPCLSFCVAHHHGLVLDLAWCPHTGVYQDPRGAGLPRMGLLAAAFSDSVIRIYSLPHPQHLEKESSAPLFTVIPAAVLQPLHGEPSGKQSACTALSWQRTEACDRIAAGYGNGLVCVWLVNTEANILWDGGQVLSPYVLFQAHGTPVTSISFSGSRFLCTSSFDKTLKFHDLMDTSLPFCSLRRGMSVDSRFAAGYCGAITSLEDGLPFKCSSYFKECGTESMTCVNVSNISIATCASVSDILNAHALADIKGGVYVSFVRNLCGDTSKQVCFNTHGLFRTHVVPLHDEVAATMEAILAKIEEPKAKCKETKKCEEKYSLKPEIVSLREKYSVDPNEYSVELLKDFCAPQSNDESTVESMLISETLQNSESDYDGKVIPGDKHQTVPNNIPNLSVPDSQSNGQESRESIIQQNPDNCCQQSVEDIDMENKVSQDVPKDEQCHDHSVAETMILQNDAPSSDEVTSTHFEPQAVDTLQQLSKDSLKHDLNDVSITSSSEEVSEQKCDDAQSKFQADDLTHKIDGQADNESAICAEQSQAKMLQEPHTYQNEVAVSLENTVSQSNVDQRNLSDTNLISCQESENGIDNQVQLVKADNASDIKTNLVAADITDMKENCEQEISPSSGSLDHTFSVVTNEAIAKNNFLQETSVTIDSQQGEGTSCQQDNDSLQENSGSEQINAVVAPVKMDKPHESEINPKENQLPGLDELRDSEVCSLKDSTIIEKELPFQMDFERTEIDVMYHADPEMMDGDVSDSDSELEDWDERNSVLSEDSMLSECSLEDSCKSSPCSSPPESPIPPPSCNALEKSSVPVNIDKPVSEEDNSKVNHQQKTLDAEEIQNELHSIKLIEDLLTAVSDNVVQSVIAKEKSVPILLNPTPEKMEVVPDNIVSQCDDSHSLEAAEDVMEIVDTELTSAVKDPDINNVAEVDLSLPNVATKKSNESPSTNTLKNEHLPSPNCTSNDHLHPEITLLENSEAEQLPENPEKMVSSNNLNEDVTGSGSQKKDAPTPSEITPPIPMDFHKEKQVTTTSNSPVTAAVNVPSETISAAEHLVEVPPVSHPVEQFQNFHMFYKCNTRRAFLDSLNERKSRKEVEPSERVLITPKEAPTCTENGLLFEDIASNDSLVSNSTEESLSLSDRCSPKASITALSWNPNVGCHQWMCAANNSGIVRIISVADNGPPST